MSRTSLVRSLALTALALMVGAQSLTAQATWSEIKYDFKHGVGDILYVWASPLRADARDWSTALGVLGTAAVISLEDEGIDRWISRADSNGRLRYVDPFREKSSSPFNDIGTLRIQNPVMGGVYLVGVVTGSEAIRDGAMGCTAAGEGNSIPRHIIYETISRRRPSTANGDASMWKLGGGDWEDHSFFGGHVANAIACATFLNTRFELGPLEPLMFVTAAGVGVARMADRRHWASDSFLGFVYGYAIGRMVGVRQRERREEQQSARVGAPVGETARPRLDGRIYTGNGPAGLVVGWKGTF
jgi:hypothetical protein